MAEEAEKKQPPDAAIAAETAGDKQKRIGSAHGDAGKWVEKSGYAHDINAIDMSGGSSEEVRGGLASRRPHPSRNLSARARGFGIGGGYERPYRKEKPRPADAGGEMYGPLPPGGYYGTGIGARPFERGRAGFADELSWYRSQYGEKTSGYEKRKK
ncbi:MAG TPA: hypothetical protein VKA60_21730 [Blastocatellia bacterium]|nr:hypothetical protein [Blastocatellia bacterium]